MTPVYLVSGGDKIVTVAGLIIMINVAYVIV